MRAWELLSEDKRLKAYVHAVGTCKDRLLFYKVLLESGPEKAYLALSKRVGLNEVWLQKIREFLQEFHNAEEQSRS